MKIAPSEQLHKAEQGTDRILPAYSGAAEPPDDRIYIDSGSEFSTVADGTEREEFLGIMDELMETLRIVNPPLYAGVLRKFQK